MREITAYKIGFCDGLLGRDCKNPYDYAQSYSMASYTNGFLHGMERRKRDNITLTYERQEK